MNTEKELISAVSEGNLSLVKSILKKGDVNINCIDEFGYSLLHSSIRDSMDLISDFLLSNSIDVNLQDKKGQTPLHYCSFYNKKELAHEILCNNGDLSIEDIYGNQPLWTAVFNDYGRNERRSIIELYVNNGADIKHKNKAGRSPYDIVESRPYTNLFDLFGI